MEKKEEIAINNGKEKVFNPNGQYALTKREYFASIAIQGAALNLSFGSYTDDDFVMVCKNAVKIADELLKQLEEAIISASQNTESNEGEKKENDIHMLYHECLECNSRCNCTDIECSCCNELDRPIISQLNSTEEGRLVLAALIKITTESETGKTPYQVLEQLKVIVSESINPPKEK